MTQVLDTERLQLRLLTRDETRDLLEGKRDPDRPYAPGYPLDGTLVAAAMVVQHHEQGAQVGNFGQYQVIRRSDGLVIGDVGFHAPPDAEGDMSVGFGIVPGARGEGFATEALDGLLRWALAQPEVKSIHADTDFVNIASQHVLTAAGMTLLSDEGDRQVYEIRAGEVS